MTTSTDRMRRLRERERNDQIAVRGTIHKSDKPTWDKINIDHKEEEKSDDGE